MRFLSKAVSLLLTAALLLSAGCTVSQNSGTKDSSSVAESSENLLENVDNQMIVPAERPTELTFEIPANFTESSSKFCNQFYVHDDASIIITSEKQAIHGIRLDEYAAETKFTYETTAEEYKLKEENTKQIHGKDCVILEFTYAIPAEDGNHTMHAMTALFMENDTAYVMTCKSKEETFLTYKSGFNKAIDSIQIADTKQN